MKKINFKILILIISLLVVVITSILLYNYIPRISYELNDDTNTYYVKKVYGTKEVWEIPNEYKGVKVEGISARAFYQNKYVKEVILPQNIKYIERLAFSECKNLEEINLNYVVEIQRNAFTYCESLVDLDIYAKHIGASAFYGCISLENINLHEGLESIGSMAFSYSQIEVLDIPRSTKNIYVNCFIYCDKLRQINIYGDFLKGNNYLKDLNIVNYME